MIVVDNVLARYGFEWSVRPYQILDSKTKKVVVSGNSFDLTDKSLQNLRKTYDNKQATLFSRP